MLKVIALIASLAGHSAAAVVIRPVILGIPGAHVAGYAVPQASLSRGLDAAFKTLTAGSLTPAFSPIPGVEPYLVAEVQARSLRLIAPQVSKQGVAVARMGSTIVLMPAKGRGLESKVAVMPLSGEEYQIGTMRELGKAYAKAVGNGYAGFEMFEELFDGAKTRRLPGLPRAARGGIIPADAAREMRHDEWKATKRYVESVVDWQGTRP